MFMCSVLYPYIIASKTILKWIYFASQTGERTLPRVVTWVDCDLSPLTEDSGNTPHILPGTAQAANFPSSNCSLRNMLCLPASVSLPPPAFSVGLGEDTRDLLQEGSKHGWKERYWRSLGDNPRGRSRVLPHCQPLLGYRRLGFQHYHVCIEGPEVCLS